MSQPLRWAGCEASGPKPAGTSEDERVERGCMEVEVVRDKEDEIEGVCTEAGQAIPKVDPKARRKAKKKARKKACKKAKLQAEFDRALYSARTNEKDQGQAQAEVRYSDESARTSTNSGNPQEESLEELPKLSPLLDATVSGDAATCLAMLSCADLQDINAKLEGCGILKSVWARSGATALHCAAVHCLVDVCRNILGRSDFTEADAVDERGQTALHYAVMAGSMETCLAIMEHPGFTALSAMDHHFLTAKGLAKLHNRADMAELMIEW